MIDEEEERLVRFIPRLKAELNSKYNYLYNDEAVRAWLKQKLYEKEDISMESMRKYVRVIYDFTHYVQKSASTLVSEVKEDIRQATLNSTKPELGSKMLRNFYVNLTSKQKLDYDYAISQIVTARELMLKNGAEFSFSYPGRTKDAKAKTVFRLETETLKGIVAGLPDSDELKLYVMVAKDCGLSPVDLLSLQTERDFDDGQYHYASIKDQVLAGKEFIMLGMKRQKTNQQFISFLGPESRKFLNLQRDRVFTWTATNTIRDRFHLLKERTGQSLLSPKSLRSWFDRQLAAMKVEKDIREVFMGHAIKDIAKFYERFTPSELEEFYVSAYSRLRVLSS